MAHTHETICLTITAFLVRDGNALLVHHPRYEKWLPIGGHIDPGEDTDQALFREIKEEAGFAEDQIRIFGEKPAIPGKDRSFMYTPMYIDKHKAADREHVALVYFGEVLGNAEAKLSEEHIDMKWFTKEQLEASAEIPADIVWFALEALKKAAK